MENAQLLVLEMLFPVHQSIAMDRLAVMVSMRKCDLPIEIFNIQYSISYIAVDMCEKWVKELIEKEVVKMTVNEKGHVVMTKTTPSVYGLYRSELILRYAEVMEKSKELEKRVEALQQMLAPKA